jgi:DNA-binding transcriptional ArsR family regulator
VTTLTRDLRITYCVGVPDDDLVFRALSDPTRRLLLDRLFERDGRTLGELQTEVPQLSRFGVMKHLTTLEQADLVVTRKDGRRKLHFLNPVPIRQIVDRWIEKYRAGALDTLIDLKNRLEDTT